MTWGKPSPDCPDPVIARSEATRQSRAREAHTRPSPRTRTKDHPPTRVCDSVLAQHTLPLSAPVGRHAAHAGMETARAISARSPHSSAAPTFRASRRHVLPDGASRVLAAWIPWTHSRLLAAGPHRDHRRRSYRRSPTDRRGQTVAIQAPARARRFRSISACASFINWACDTGGSVSSSAARTLALNHAS